MAWHGGARRRMAGTSACLGPPWRGGAWLCRAGIRAVQKHGMPRQGMARHTLAWFGTARQGAWHGLARHLLGGARRRLARPGAARITARHAKAGIGTAWRGSARQGAGKDKARFGIAWHGAEWPAMARRGGTWPGMAWNWARQGRARQGRVRPRLVWPGKARAKAGRSRARRAHGKGWPGSARHGRPRPGRDLRLGMAGLCWARQGRD